MFSKMRITKSTENCLEHETLKTEPAQADAVVVGAGAGLSTAAGFVYNGERFTHYFSDLEAKYGFRICIRKAIIRILRWRSIGRTGAVISLPIGLWMRRNRYTTDFFSL